MARDFKARNARKPLKYTVSAPIFGRNHPLAHRRTYRGSPKLPIKGRYAKSWAAEASIKGRYWARPGGSLACASLGTALGGEPDEGDHGFGYQVRNRAHQALCVRPGRTEHSDR